MKVWKAFARSRGLRVTCFTLAGALLLSSAVGLALPAAPVEEVPTAQYEHKGRFHYTVYLKPSILYGDIILAEEEEVEVAVVPMARALGPGLVYFRRLIDNIQASFSYRFLSDRPISEQSQKVEVTVVIENPGIWSRSLVLMPETSKVGDFAIYFPIDIHFFTMVIDAIGQETGVRGVSHRIVITADVHTIAHTDVGTIDEVFTQILGATMEANTLVFDQELSRSQAGTIGGTPLPGASPAGLWRTPSIIGLVVALLALGFLGWNQAHLGMAMLSAGEAEAARAGKKYKQLMVDVEELPWVKPTETVIALSSLDDLARISDDLVKPVLHQAGEGAHTYCIIDGSVRYLHIIKT